jgi:hypothetical protein
VPALWLVAGCASEIAGVNGRYQHTRYDFTIGSPDAPWKRSKIEGAWIAFRRPGPQTMSMQVRCERPVTEPVVMARTLVLGIPDRNIVQSGPLRVADGDGWTQTFDTHADGTSVRVKTVTLVIERCVYDWTLAASGDFAEAERAFDAWWASFRLGASGSRGSS